MNVPVARRIIAASLVVIASVGVGALPASAHGTNGQPIPDAAHYLSQITGFGPATPGLTASIDPRGEWIEVTNTSGKDLTILGYAREPYLQITSSGVAENTYSPTLALNQSLFGDLSQLGDSALPPAWRHTSGAQAVRWHDHRIHWMGATRPPAVRAHPQVGRVIGNWTVHMILGTQPIVLNGTLSWLPIKQISSALGTTFLIIDAAVFALAVAAGAWLLRRRRDRHANLDGTGEEVDVERTVDPSALLLPPTERLDGRAVTRR